MVFAGERYTGARVTRRRSRVRAIGEMSDKGKNMRYETSKGKYKGVFIAAPTPMNDDESLDLFRLGELIRYYRAAGLANGNCVCTLLGAGGEAMHLDKEERMQVAETAVEAAEGQIPIFVGVAHTRTRTAVELARHADQIGADGLQVDLPYYFANTADDGFAFVQEVAEAVECGIGLYPTPWTSGLAFDGALLEQICEALPNVIGLKWWSADITEWFRVIEAFSERLSIVSNCPAMIGPSAFMLGVCGYVSQGVSAAPRQNVQIVQWLQSGQYDKALHWIRTVEDGYDKIEDAALRAGYSGEGNYIKAAMQAVGFPCGPARLPNRPMPPHIGQRFETWASTIAALLEQDVPTSTS